jgi:Protein of unknown function (DUF2958)
MKFLTSEIREQWLANGRSQRRAIDAGDASLDFEPVVKHFTPDANATWLLTELDDKNLAFALCDCGLGEPELGCVSLAELESVRGPLGLRIERDLYFTADKTISAYADEARRCRR